MSPAEPVDNRPATAVGTAVERLSPPQSSTAVSTAVESPTAAHPLHRSHTRTYEGQRHLLDCGAPRCHRTPTAVPFCLRGTAVECSPLPIGEHDSTAVTNDGMTKPPKTPRNLRAELT